jgi:hypothetical protein
MRKKTIPNRVLSLEGGYVEIADSEKLNDIGSQVTIEAWVRVTEFTSHHMPIIYKGDTPASDLPSINFACLVRRDCAICLNAPPSGRGVHILHSPQGLIDLNTWFHIAGVVNGKNRSMSVFFNGAEVARTSFNGNLLNQSAPPLRIGWMHEDETLSDHPFVGQIGEVRIRNTAGTQDEIHFAGQIDEVRIWNTARTQDEIQAAMHKSLTGEEPGLIGYWNFDLGSPNTVIDSSPERSHGKLVGDAYLVEAELPKQGEATVPAVISGRIMDEKGQPRQAWYKLKCDGEEIESGQTNISGEYRISHTASWGRFL